MSGSIKSNGPPMRVSHSDLKATLNHSELNGGTLENRPLNDNGWLSGLLARPDSDAESSEHKKRIRQSNSECISEWKFAQIKEPLKKYVNVLMRKLRCFRLIGQFDQVVSACLSGALSCLWSKQKFSSFKMSFYFLSTAHVDHVKCLASSKGCLECSLICFNWLR